MGEQTFPVQTGSQLTANTDISQVFIGNTFTRVNSSVNNSLYVDLEIKAGTLMGRITASGICIPFKSDASDGSQNIVGLMNNTIVIPAGETVNCDIVIKGEVATNKLVFAKVGDTIQTIVSTKRVLDKIASETAGILLVNTREMTDFDNS